ncbi:Myb domain [Arabidopsis thaliana x Arabidopsis arenosa]|uniref:Myb domain n=1 Tax=Arabidopsis thaliana x Arabidopsis arenosa TaxID=1240361 RepID=A0A8T2C3I9_9BRAS|nr:Myb domain [Arabidopsis thaliana x Arabidopsis arenosa]KAG7592971.1 Myb domain [Arabidopsis thaliana x Arabidopsis arenosa]
MMMFKSGDMDYTQKMKRCHEYVEALEEEQKKIQVFQRELPLCLELVTQAIESCRKELSGSSEHVGGQSECSERTTSECGGGGGGAVFEEFIPIKWSSSSSDETDKDEEAENNGGDKKKSDWLRSVQLWNQSPDPKPKEDHVINKKMNVIEVKRNAGAFQPIQKEKPKAADSQPLKTITPTSTTTSSSTAETVGGKSEFEDQKQSHLNRKQRRCWSPELHRRFLHALQQLGGSHGNLLNPLIIRIIVLRQVNIYFGLLPNLQLLHLSRLEIS